MDPDLIDIAHYPLEWHPTWLRHLRGYVDPDGVGHAARTGLQTVCYISTDLSWAPYVTTLAWRAFCLECAHQIQARFVMLHIGNLDTELPF